MQAYLVDSMEFAQQTLVCAQHAEDDYSLVVISFAHVFAAAVPPLPETLLQYERQRRHHHHHHHRAVSSVWRRLDYADAIAQFVLLKIPENNGVITQRMAVCTPTWRLSTLHTDEPQADNADALESTIYYIQYVEFADGSKHNSLLHRFTLYHAGSRSVRPRLHLEARLYGCVPLPNGIHASTSTSLSFAGRCVIAASASRSGDFPHFKFSVRKAEERQRAALSSALASHCVPIELEGVEKGYSFEVEPYSGAVLYTLAREETVVIRYYD